MIWSITTLWCRQCFYWKRVGEALGRGLRGNPGLVCTAIFMAQYVPPVHDINAGNDLFLPNQLSYLSERLRKQKTGKKKNQTNKKKGTLFLINKLIGKLNHFLPILFHQSLLYISHQGLPYQHLPFTILGERKGERKANKQKGFTQAWG